MDTPGVTVPVMCKNCRKPVNLRLLQSAQPTLDRLLSTAPPAMGIATLRHRCGSEFIITVGDLRAVR